jgi:hypothetical protein
MSDVGGMPKANLGGAIQPAVTQTPAPQPAAGNEPKSTPNISLADALKGKDNADTRIADLEKKLDGLDKRYAASSDEGKKLNAALKQAQKDRDEAMQQLELARPILDKIQTDKDFANKLTTLIKTGSVPSTSARTEVKPEDFGIAEEDLDFAEALANAKSPSGQFLRTLIKNETGAVESLVDQKVRDALTQYDAMTRQNQARQTDAVKRANFLKTHPDLTNDDIDAMLARMKDKEWDYEDLLRLEGGTAGAGVQDPNTTIPGMTVHQGGQQARQIPLTLAGRGSGGTGALESQPDPGKAIMDLVREQVTDSIMKHAKLNPGPPIM